MNERKIAYRYARAVFQTAFQDKCTDDVLEKLQLFDEVSKKMPKILFDLDREDILLSKRMEIAEKLSKIFLFNAFLSSTLKLLVDRKRTRLMPYICRQYEKFYDNMHKINRISVTVFEEGLVAPMCAEIKNIAEKAIGGEIICTGNADRSILGGIKLKIAGAEYDMSVAKKLSDIKNVLSEALPIRGL